jgi:hypothetical protein
MSNFTNERYKKLWDDEIIPQKNEKIAELSSNPLYESDVEVDFEFMAFVKSMVVGVCVGAPLVWLLDIILNTAK